MRRRIFVDSIGSLFSKVVHRPKTSSKTFFDASRLNESSNYSDLRSDKTSLMKIDFSRDESISKSVSESSAPVAEKKKSKLKILDTLNKDGNRHFVLHKENVEQIRKRREKKRAARSREKTRRIEEKIQSANERWKKFSNLDDELTLFVSRYSQDLPLCEVCRKYFLAEKTNFLTDDPRASLDFAAEEALRSATNRTLTLHQAAKSKIIRDYDKQSNVIFNLCDECLTKCDEIRRELKQFRDSRREKQNSSETKLSEIQRVCVDNLRRFHFLKLKQLYRETQEIIRSSTRDGTFSSIERDFQASLDQMKFHRSATIKLESPQSNPAFSYRPEFDQNYLSYRTRSSCDSKSTDDDRVTIDTCDRIIEYCGLIENTDESSFLCQFRSVFLDAPLDDFIRGIEILRSLTKFPLTSKLFEH